MKKNGYIQKCLIPVITFLFIFSIITPFVIGHETELKNIRLLDDLAFDCYDKYGFSKTIYYREHLQTQRSEMIESEEVDSTFELPSTEQSDGPMNSPWPMKCHDNRHTGRSPYSTENNHGVEIWRFNCDWVESGSIIDDNGDIYFGCSNYYLYVLNPNGTLKWKYKTNGKIWSTPAIVEDGTIYITSYDDHLYAINPNGSLKWSYDADASITSSPAIAEDGTIYFGTMGAPSWGCRIYAIDSNGMEKWYYNTGYKIASDPAIGDDGTVYIGSGDGYLYAMNPNGTLHWRYKTEDEIHSHPSIGTDGTIFFGSNDNYLYALYPNGSLRWKYKLNGNLYSSASIGENGVIYVPDHDLYAIHSNGTLKWQFDFGNECYVGHSSPAISADGTIYIGTHIGSMSGGEIIAINSDGTERWRNKIANDWVESSPCISKDGTVYIGSSSEDEFGYSYGYLHSFSTPDSPLSPTITGSTTGKIGEKQYYTFNTTDYQGDDIEYFVDWGDNAYSGWTEASPSGLNITLNHTWTEEGTFEIRARARDIYGYVSDWTELEVCMPKNKIISSPFIQFLENHQRLFPILRNILKL